MNSDRIYLVTDTPPGEGHRATLVLGPLSHELALDTYRLRHPGRQPMAVVSLEDMEQTVLRIRQAMAQGDSADLEIIRQG